MPWNRRGAGYFDHRAGYGRAGPWDRDYDEGPYRGRSYDRGPRDRRYGRGRSYDRNYDRGYDRDRGYGRRAPTYWDRNGDGVDDRLQTGRGYRRPTYNDRNGDGIDDRYQRPVNRVRTTRYVDDYDRGSRYYNDAPVTTKRTTYTSDPYYDNRDSVVTRTTRPVNSGDTVVKKTTTTRTVSD
jgi:hypothetical protein